jgi:hypothetical protein
MSSDGLNRLPICFVLIIYTDSEPRLLYPVRERNLGKHAANHGGLVILIALCHFCKVLSLLMPQLGRLSCFFRLIGVCNRGDFRESCQCEYVQLWRFCDSTYHPLVTVVQIILCQV